MVQNRCTLNNENDVHPNRWPLSATLPGVTTGRNPTSTKDTLKKEKRTHKFSN